MKDFFKTVLGSFIGTFIGGICLLVVGFVFVIAVMASLWTQAQQQQWAKPPKENTVLELNLGFDIPQYMSQDPLDRIDLNTFELKNMMGLDSLLMSIDRAARDDRVVGIKLNLNGYRSNWSTTWEIRQALAEFQAQEKWIVCYGESFTQQQYYLASMVDYLYLHPQGAIELTGLSMTSIFFGRLLEKLDVDVQMFRGANNIYKSAVEPFTRENFSEENKEQMNEIVQGLWEVISGEILESRNITKENLDELIAQLGPRHAQAALDAGLVDDLLDDQAVVEMIDEEINEEITKPKRMSIFKYASHFKYYPTIQHKASEPSIALIHADGPIQASQGEPRVIYAKKFNKWIKQAVEDENVSGIVVRVNSPGGGAFASELIHNEIRRATEVKPVIVSFGDMAASGGYYLSCSANQIVAGPTTLTGSIGVFGVMPTLGEFLEKHTHITYDGVTTHPHSDVMNGLRPLSIAEQKLVQLRIDDIYNLFKSRVKEGRAFSDDEVESVARGRVWHGVDALENKLVDRMGGLMTTIRMMQKQLDLEASALNIKVWPRTLQWEEWMKDFNFETKIIDRFSAYPEQVKETIQQYELLKSDEKIQTRFPFILKIQ